MYRENGSHFHLYSAMSIIEYFKMESNSLGVFTSAGVTGYKGIRVTFCNVFKWRKVTLIPLYPVTPVFVNTPIISLT